jgi:hypothetical protein
MQVFHLFQFVHQPNNPLGNNVYVFICPALTLAKILLGRRNNEGAFASPNYAGTVTCICNNKLNNFLIPHPSSTNILIRYH